MLQFRFSTVPKELFKATLKRPLPCSRQTTWSPTRRCSVDARAVCPHLKVFHAAANRPALRTAPSVAPFRSYCVKPEGAVELDEQLKKDGVDNEAVGDKYVLSGFFCLGKWGVWLNDMTPGVYGDSWRIQEQADVAVIVINAVLQPHKVALNN